jgi:hypothetical protein
MATHEEECCPEEWTPSMADPPQPLFWGGDKINTMVSEILTTLQALHYGGDHKKLIFNKYCTAHVEKHNQHAALDEYGVTPLEETMMIHYFEGGIFNSSFASIKSTIMVECQKFQEFDAVMQLYVNFKRLQKSEVPSYQACNVSAIQGLRGGRQGCGGRSGGGRGEPNSCILGLVPQEEVDKVSTVKNRYYPASKYNKLTPAKKAKLFQLKNPGKIPGTGLSGRKTNKANKSSASVAELTSAITAVSAAALAISEFTAVTTKQTAADEGGTNDNDQNVGINSQWGRSRDNPAIAARQGGVPKKQKS